MGESPIEPGVQKIAQSLARRRSGWLTHPQNLTLGNLEKTLARTLSRFPPTVNRPSGEGGESLDFLSELCGRSLRALRLKSFICRRTNTSWTAPSSFSGKWVSRAQRDPVTLLAFEHPMRDNTKRIH